MAKNVCLKILSSYRNSIDDAECELNCKPIGLNYFATLNERVVDGTSCFKPSEFLKLRRNHAGKAICVDGICKVSRF